MFKLILGVILILVGVIVFLVAIRKDSLDKLIDDLENGNNNDYVKTIGKVICYGYKWLSTNGTGTGEEYSTESIFKTPIVEYEVDGEVYEKSGTNNHEELPVGTRITLWYLREDPKESVLGIDLKKSNPIYGKIISIILILVGVLEIFFWI